MSEPKRIPGQHITGMSTLGSMYDKNIYVNVWFDLNGEKVEGRITTNTIMQMVNEFVFEVRKARKYHHLESPVRIGSCDDDVVGDKEFLDIVEENEG